MSRVRKLAKRRNTYRKESECLNVDVKDLVEENVYYLRNTYRINKELRIK